MDWELDQDFNGGLVDYKGSCKRLEEEKEINRIECFGWLLDMINKSWTMIYSNISFLRIYFKGIAITH